jgi:putative transcription factor
MKGRGRDVVIEGASMIVCPQCAAKFGAPVPTESKAASSGSKQRPPWTAGSYDRPVPTGPGGPKAVPTRRPKPRPKQTGALLNEMELVENYADVIREARQKVGLSQEELAQKVGERLSTLQAIEAGRQKPTEKTLRGLERELEVSLLEAVGAVPLRPAKESGAPSAPTLGDRVVVKRKMSQKARREDAQTK